jgi:hypothetical protein
MVHKVDKNIILKFLISYWTRTCSGQQTVETTSNLGGGYVNAGSETNEQLVIWQRFQDKILIKLKSNAVANDSLPISISVKIITMSQLCSLLILLLSVKIQLVR